MPEIIEIRKYADFLKRKLKNQTITEINILSGRYRTHSPFELYRNLKNNLPIKVTDVKTKGKFLYIILDNNYYVFSTLGLSGGWTWSKDRTKFEFIKILSYVDKHRMSIYLNKALNHLNVEFKTKNGSMFFYDTLSFGTIKVIKGSNELEKKLNTIGPDIMKQSTTFDIFTERLNKKPDKKIGLVLMNQKIISGIGNYLRADILWLSKVNPFKKVSKLTDTELKNIFHSSKLLTWGNYNRPKAILNHIIKKSDKMPIDYHRDFFVYGQDTDIYGNIVKKKELYEGSQKRYIHWVPNRHK